MYKHDQKAIADWAWRSEENLVDVMLFVRVTIQRHFYMVPREMARWKKHGITGLSRKTDREALPSIRDVAHTLHRDMPPKDMLRECLHIKGIGIPKAGFIVQLLLGQAGCMDTHNLKRFGLRAHTFHVSAKAPWKTVEAKLELYLACCADKGGSEYLWDSWCTLLVEKSPYNLKKYGSAGFVSYLHVACLVP